MIISNMKLGKRIHLKYFIFFSQYFPYHFYAVKKDVTSHRNHCVFCWFPDPQLVVCFAGSLTHRLFVLLVP